MWCVLERRERERTNLHNPRKVKKKKKQEKRRKIKNGKKIPKK